MCVMDGVRCILNVAAVSLKQVRGLEQQVHKETLASTSAEEAAINSTGGI